MDPHKGRPSSQRWKKPERFEGQRCPFFDLKEETCPVVGRTLWQGTGFCKLRTSVIQSKGTKFCQKPGNPEEPQPALLISASCDLEQRTQLIGARDLDWFYFAPLLYFHWALCVHCKLSKCALMNNSWMNGNCEIRHFYCFKLQSLW